jgi:PAS domain S-box-containing protein
MRVRGGLDALQRLGGRTIRAGRVALAAGTPLLLHTASRLPGDDRMTENQQSRPGAARQERSLTSEPPALRSIACLPAMASSRLIRSGELLGTGDPIVANVSYRSSSPQDLVPDAHLAEMDDRILDLLPVGIYVCAPDASILRYNQRAVELWGRVPKIADAEERFCGAYRLYRLDGTYVPHAECPMADILRTGISVVDEEIVIERPDGSRVVALVNIRAIRSDTGRVLGAVNCIQELKERRATPPLGNGRVVAAERGSLALAEALPAAIYTADPAGRITYYNQAAAELWGHRPEPGETEWCGSWKLYRPDGTPLPRQQCAMALAVKEQRPILGAEAVAERPDGTRVPFMAFPTPLRDASGQIAGAVNMLVDITDRKRAEVTLARRMDEQGALYRLSDRLYRARSLGDIYDAALDAILRALRCERASILLLDASGVMRFVAWRELSDGYRRAVEGHSPWARDTTDPEPVCVDDVETAGFPESLKVVVKTERIGALAFIPVMTGGALAGKFMAYYDAPHAFTDADIDLAVTIARQLGFGLERTRAEEQRTLLLREMSHRVKNLFAVTGSLVTLSARRAASPADMASAVNDRLAALTRAHELTRPGMIFEQPSESRDSTLHALIRTIFSPYARTGLSNEPECVMILGRDLRISGNAVTSLALFFHELATNAAKHGALSSPLGVVNIHCNIENDQLSLTWKEQGGPSIDGQPDNSGFGGMLTRRVITGQFGGRMDEDWQPEGLVVRIRLPTDRLLV